MCMYGNKPFVERPADILTITTGFLAMGEYQYELQTVSIPVVSIPLTGTH